MRIETVSLETIDGLALQGDLALTDGDAVGAVVLTHPHPLYGGDRHNHVVEALFQALPEAGLHTVRFDFRGVGNSEGEHAGGVDERMDVAAAVDLAAALVGDDPIWLVGYSFGAAVALDVVEPRVHGWVAVAPPLALLGADRLAATDARPALMLVPEHDQFGGPEVVAPLVEGWLNTTLRAVPMADHSLVGATRTVVAETLAFIGPD